MKSKSRGFTLIEMMITVAIIGILASIALPAYQSYVLRANRVEAKEALMAIQLDQAKWRANNSSYQSDFTKLACSGAACKTPGKNFTFAISGASATGYTATATATGNQTKDAGCTSMTITVSATAPSGTAGPSTCW